MAQQPQLLLCPEVPTLEKQGTNGKVGVIPKQPTPSNICSEKSE